ncbi:hypothetical protein [Sphingobium sp.]|uniref:hypothetical protein n=1 Tax=Sphingobium sp. TaxID=1912891 RepID=UPI003B3A906C
MPFAALFSGMMMPVLLMLSPLAVIAASHCGDRHPAASPTASANADRACIDHPLPLM